MDETNQRDILNFLRARNFHTIRALGRGGFGDVLSATSEEHGNVAVKIIKNRVSWPIEERVWPVLRHTHILPVLEVFIIDLLDVKLYVMPLHPKALDAAVREIDIQSDSHGLNRIKKWFTEVLLGLNHLHAAGYCHLDIKSDNVLVSAEDEAILCDFSDLNYTDRTLSRLCAPLEFRPPECYGASRNNDVRGIPFDVWTFDVMGLNRVTGHWSIGQMKNVDESWTWVNDVMSFIAKSLEEPMFRYLVRTTFPRILLSDEELDHALDFFTIVLRREPENRPSTAELLLHPPSPV